LHKIKLTDHTPRYPLYLTVQTHNSHQIISYLLSREAFTITRAINCGAKYLVDSREFCGRGCYISGGKIAERQIGVHKILIKNPPRDGPPNALRGWGAKHSCRLRVASYGLRVAGYGLRVTGCELRVAGYGLRVASCGLRVAGYGLRVAGYELRVARCGLRVAGWR